MSPQPPLDPDGSPSGGDSARLPRIGGASDEQARLVAGVAQALVEHGYAGLTVEQVIAAAGVPAATFYRYYDNKQDAVLAAHDVVFERCLASLSSACGREQEWPCKVKAAIAAALSFAAEEPAQAQLLSLDAIAADSAVTSRVLTRNDQLAALLSVGRQCTPRGPELPDLTEKALVGAVLAIIADRLAKGEASSLRELESQIVELVLIPYLGSDQAARAAGGSA